MSTTNHIQNKKFDSEIGKVLHLMIHSLYTNKEIFLRELISNASDACDKFRYEMTQNSQLGSEEVLKITIKIDQSKQTLTISDNGIGMNEIDLIENLGRIASSGTQRFLEQLGKNGNDLSLIGQFGVGFYSIFMVADTVKVYSTKFSEQKTYLWESDGKEGYKITTLEEQMPHGTSIELHIKPSDVEFLESYRIKYIINTYSDHIDFPIELIENDGEPEVINSSSPIWTRPKSEISDEQYVNFYHKVAHMPDEPLFTIHNKVEGNLEYINLLFIPKQAPFDLFHPDRSARVKLYVKKVFITDDVDVIPRYMRFLRGIIDSSDLPLNISRETLQQNATVHKIRKSVVKRVLSTLKQASKENPELYKEFWMSFGEVMKEGLCEPALEEKEDLLDACRFYSTKSGDEFIDLNTYVDRMHSEQSEIYYITGQNLDVLRQNPQLEGFAKRNIEVLLLTDHVDEFWVNVISQYKNKFMKSILVSDINLDEIQKLPEDSKSTASNHNDAEQEALKAYIKNVLGDRIKDVRLSTKLVESPACLAISEGSMNIKMENLLIEQKQLNKRSAKILEVNALHPLLIKIMQSVSEGLAGERESEMVEIIFGQACLIAGEPISNPVDFVTKLNKLLIT